MIWKYFQTVVDIIRKAIWERELRNQLISNPTRSYVIKYVLNSLSIKLLQKTDNHVFYGPFQLMKIPKDTFLSDPSKILGTYEHELHPIISKLIIETTHRTFVDIGSSYGYYLVGLTHANPFITCIGYEMVDEYRQKSIELAELNEVKERISFRGSCSKETLQKELPENAFVLADCEGAELDILVPAEIPAMRSATLLIEVHDFLMPGTRKKLIERFAESHHIEIIYGKQMDPNSLSILNGFSQTEKILAIRENRFINNQMTNAEWLYMKPRH